MWWRTLGGLVTLILTLLATLLAADAQRAGKVPRIGVLSANSQASEASLYQLEAFRQGLRDLGYVEGQNLTVEYRFAEWHEERLAALAAELVGLPVDVLVTRSAPAAHAARHATSTIPIVFSNVNDPVRQGIVASLAQPGGNLTGLSTLSSEISGKRLQLLKEAIPGLQRVAVVWHAANPGMALQFRETQDTARVLGLELHSLEVRSPDDVDRVVAAARAERVEGLVVLPGLPVRSPMQVVDFAITHRLPAIYAERELVQAGGLMSYGPNYREIARRAAAYVDKILKGAKPVDLPVEQAMWFEFVINLKTAQALGLTLPPVVLFQADEVIK
jgi:putative tryptophan/tyrosine transport system substrate-binding protein